MGWREKLKETKIPNLDADIELLKKRRKKTKYFSWFHLSIYLMLFIAAVYGIIIILDAAMVEEPTLHLTTLIVGLGITINFLLYASLRNYITALDWCRDGKFYDLLIYLKENKKL